MDLPVVLLDAPDARQDESGGQQCARYAGSAELLARRLLALGYAALLVFALRSLPLITRSPLPGATRAGVFLWLDSLARPMSSLSCRPCATGPAPSLSPRGGAIYYGKLIPPTRQYRLFAAPSPGTNPYGRKPASAPGAAPLSARDNLMMGIPKSVGAIDLNINGTSHPILYGFCKVGYSSEEQARTGARQGACFCFYQM